MSSDATPALFRPIQVGDVTLAHRVVLAPQTRVRADAAHVPTDLVREFYKQRASVPGTLLITEAAFIAPKAGIQAFAPGIWNDEQVAAWKKVTDAVHAKGSYIYLQLWALGRAARPEHLHKEYPDAPYVAASPIALSTSPEDVPRELTKEEITEYLQWYATAAANAVKGAGFDGVEIHGANGYLPDQFLQDVSNTRTDEYGGSIENRAKFPLEIVDAVVGAVGASRVGIRLSPWGTYQDMRMDNPVPTFSYLVENIKEKHPDFAYIHVVSPFGLGSKGPEDPAQNDFIYDIWKPRPLITTGGYDRDLALKVAEETGQLIGFARAFSANPDLPFRFQKNIPLQEIDYETLYTPSTPKGYTDYPFSEEFLKSQA
ncbi:NADH:flavin oxidoreductase/NADH oxidase [Fomes fomentarius]|nr:NADH:flavin oxidoreductase/NADH oxidase [Fomes fomentarius]